ncbi:MAG: antibiotic biosynthesis monooxygenase [Alphaproteobacteria bacterium]|nr:antibiotic biosynthesis monooxygenase [Alphaproteobacteria bacterium]
MSDTVSWVLEMAIKPGELDNFKALMDEMVEDVQASQPNTTIYEWFYSEDGSACHIYERYSDSAAAMIHLQSFGENYAERFLGAADPTRLVVYGDPSEDVRSVVGGFGAVVMEQLGGYAR